MTSEFLIRAISHEDTESYAKFLSQLDRETKFLLFEPGERDVQFEVIEKRIIAAAQDPSVGWFLAEASGDVVGYVQASQGLQNRSRHRAYLHMGILAAYRGRGLGGQLFERIFEWARSRAVERIELTVVTTNSAAVALYTKVGFTTEGTRRRALKIDGQWADEYHMAKIF